MKMAETVPIINRRGCFCEIGYGTRLVSVGSLVVRKLSLFIQSYIAARRGVKQNPSDCIPTPRGWPSFAVANGKLQRVIS